MPETPYGRIPATEGEKGHITQYTLTNRNGMVVAPRYRRKKLPDGWFDPWICEWHCVQLRPTARLLRALTCVWS